MLQSTRQFILSLMVLSSSSFSAPITDRLTAPLVARNLLNGWQCQYEGPLNLGVDASLDLPALVANLCLMVDYGHAGCDEFRPHHHKNKKPSWDNHKKKPHQYQSQCQDSDRNSDSSECLTDHPDQNDDDGIVSIQSFDEPTEDDEQPQRPKGKKQPKKPKKHHNNHHEDIDSEPVSIQSFNDQGYPDNTSGDQQPEPDYDVQDSDEETNPNEYQQPSHQFNGNDNDDQCADSDYYCTKVNKCVDKKFFAPPQHDGRCEKGELDSVLNLCLDVSLLNASPIQVATSLAADIKHDQPEEPTSSKCPDSKQKFSSLLSACVDVNLLTSPLGDKKCKNGAKLDPLLGLCLDVSANVLGLVKTGALVNL